MAINVDSDDSNNAVDIGSGGTGSQLSDPAADRILFWDDSAAAGSNITWLTPGTGLSITATTLNVAWPIAFTSDYSNDFDAAIVAIAATPTTLYVDAASTMSTNVTVPATCAIAMLEEGSINQDTYTLAINGVFKCSDFQQAFTGTGVVTLARVNYMNPWWWGENTIPGTTDMTYEIQAALTAAYTAKVPVFYPKGTYYTDTLTYYGESMYGVPGSADMLNTTGLSVIKGMDSKDVFQFVDPSSVAKAYIRGTVVKDLSIIVDDTTDAAGSFSRDGGEVGNCAFALPCADGTTGDHTYGVNQLIHGKFENVNIESLSQTAKNNSCGIFAQGQPYDFVFDHLFLNRLEFGFWGTKPETNEALTEYAPDALRFEQLYTNDCQKPFRIYNSIHSTIDQAQVYATTSGYKGIRIEQYASLVRSETHGWTINNYYEEGNAATTGEMSKIEGRNHTIIGGTLKQNYGASYITWDAKNCHVIGTQINGLTGDASTVLKISAGANHNKFENISTKTSGMAWLEDSGYGNAVTVNEFDSKDIISSRPISQLISRVSPAFLRSADFTKSVPSTPFFSSEDLFLWPSDIDLVNDDQTITKDATIIESGEYIALPTPGDGQITTCNDEVMTLGYRFPESKVRVYIKIKAATSSTTQAWALQVNSVSKGSDTLSITTSWQTLFFDADLTGLTKGHTVRFLASAPAANQAVHIAWIAIVPFKEHDLNAHIGTGWGVYDFAVNGGAVASHRLGQLPNNAIITRAYYQVITAPTSDGVATIAIQIPTDDANGIVTATAYDDGVFTEAYHEAIQTGTVANFSEQTTAIRDVELAIAGAVLTAGKIKVWWEYVVGE